MTACVAEGHRGPCRIVGSTLKSLGCTLSVLHKGDVSRHWAEVCRNTGRHRRCCDHSLRNVCRGSALRRAHTWFNAPLLSSCFLVILEQGAPHFNLHWACKSCRTSYSILILHLSESLKVGPGMCPWKGLDRWWLMSSRVSWETLTSWEDLPVALCSLWVFWEARTQEQSYLGVHLDLLLVGWLPLN